MTPDEESGFNVSVSEREFTDLTGQIEDAMRFLTVHSEELKRLRDLPGSERLVLDFPVADKDVMIQSDSFPVDLISLMAQLKIELVVSRYPSQGS